MADFTYAVHTDVCTYLLDDAGICTWVLSPNPSASSKAMACVGAQFVSCVDPRVEGAIVGELKEGASALLVATSKETGRAQLLRTGPIRRVQQCDARVSIDNKAGLDVLEELEVELDEEPSVQAKLPIDPKSRDARVAEHRKEPHRQAKDDRTVILADELAMTATVHKPDKPKVEARVEPGKVLPAPFARAARSGKPRPTASELAGLPPPRKPMFEGSGADDTSRFSPRKTKR